MKTNFYDCKVVNRIKNHIKVPEFQVNSLGNEIIKAKRIQVRPINTQNRSNSANCNFRAVFHVPKSADKENSSKYNKVTVGKCRTENVVRHRSACRRIEVGKTTGDETSRVIPKIKTIKIGEFIQMNTKKEDELVTFRPDATPVKRGFPRDVFCIESRRKFS